MFKIISNSALCLEGALKNLALTNSQQTRSMRLRKPPWVPRAKGKQFRVPKYKEPDMQEKNYITPIWQEYKAQMRSVYQLFKTEGKFTDQASLKVKEEKRILLEKENLLIKHNDQLNKEILEQQLIDEHVKLENKKRQAEYELRKKLKIEELYFKKADEEVKKLKEKAKSFIDPNNLEYEIEKALNERHDHNFSIDVSGRFYKGKSFVLKQQAFDSKFIPLPKETGLIESQQLIENIDSNNTKEPIV